MSLAVHFDTSDSRGVARRVARLPYRLVAFRPIHADMPAYTRLFTFVLLGLLVLDLFTYRVVRQAARWRPASWAPTGWARSA